VIWRSAAPGSQRLEHPWALALSFRHCDLPVEIGQGHFTQKDLVFLFRRRNPFKKSFHVATRLKQLAGVIVLKEIEAV
jgi:hypothetical protein